MTDSDLNEAGRWPPVKHGRYIPIDVMVRFWDKVKKTNTCWLWTGYKVDGYGGFRYKGGTKAHRFSYRYHVGEIPSGLVIDHICRVRACVNPEHLRVVTNKENILSGIAPTATNARKTHCKRGHELVGSNIDIYQGRRCCLVCRREQGRIYRDRRRNK